MNTIDYKVVGKLMEEGRTTWAELGSLLGLSAPAAAERVRKLEERGVIKGYSAMISPELVGCEVTAFIFVTLQQPEHRQLFLTAIRDKKEIQECHHMAGDEDYLLKVRCGRIKELESLLSDFLKGLPGIVKTKTSIVLSTVKETTVLPVPVSLAEK